MNDGSRAEAAAFAALRAAMLPRLGAELGEFELVLDVAPGARSYAGRFSTDGHAWRDVAIDADGREACEFAIGVLGLERPDGETVARFRFAAGEADGIETTFRARPDTEALREGWRESLAGAIASIAPDRDASQGYGTLISYRLGGPDPLEFVTTIARDEPVPHWLYVTQGFSEPRDDGQNAGGAAGYGFELVLRLPPDRTSDDETAPGEPVALLQALARYVFTTGNVFVDGDYTLLETDFSALGGLSALAFVRDAELAACESPAGRIAFLSVVGLAADESDAIKAWTTYGFVDLAVARGKLTPNRITVPGRRSFLRDPAFAAAAAAGGAREGSRTGHLFVGGLSARRRSRPFRSPATILELDEAGLAQAMAVLSNRISFGRSLTLVGPSHRIVFEAAERPSLSGDLEELTVGLTVATIAELAAAFAGGSRRYAFRDLPLTLERV